MFLKLATKSLYYRKGSVIITTLALSISLIVMFGVEHIREQAKNNFTSTVSGVDIIVGSRTGEVNLLLYSVFRMGKATNNMSWQSYASLSKDPMVSWSVPLSLGDSHRGYRVLGTTADYFEYFNYGEKQRLNFDAGNTLKEVFDVVIGAEVAQKLNYQVGDQLTLSHGIGNTSFSHHDDATFRVVGILAATGTPVDQTLHVSLQGLEIVHVPAAQRKWFTNQPKQSIDDNKELLPKSVTAVMIGLTSRMVAFQFQRKVNTKSQEPLMAILPGATLAQLWQTLSVAENTLLLISSLIVISTLFGLSAMLIASIRERREEIKLLRMIGASPLFIYWLIAIEALLISFISIIVAITVLTLGLTLSKSFLFTHYGLSIGANVFSLRTLYLIGVLCILTVLAAIPPSLFAYKEANGKR
jgi:putative ABC transport system permease protein